MVVEVARVSRSTLTTRRAGNASYAQTDRRTSRDKSTLQFSTAGKGNKENMALKRKHVEH